MTCQNSACSFQPSAAHIGLYDFCGHGTVISLTFCFRTKEDCLSGENVPSGVTNLWGHPYVTPLLNNECMSKQPRETPAKLAIKLWALSLTQKFRAEPCCTEKFCQHDVDGKCVDVCKDLLRSKTDAKSLGENAVLLTLSNGGVGV